MNDLFDDLSAVWSWQAFAFAFAWGFGFSFVVQSMVSVRLARVLDGRNPQKRFALAGVATGVLAAWWVFGLDASQVLASLATGDPAWPRVLSRLFPYLAGAVGTGVGVSLGVWFTLRGRHHRGEGKHDLP